MNNYGLTKYDLLMARDKIKQQQIFLEQNEFVTANGEVKKLIDVSFGANHSYRYYAQLANKINTMEMLAFNQQLESCFLTMTLDGFYRDLLKADYSRLNEKSDEELQQILSI